MIYYQDDEITVRTREERDAQIIADEQIRQGWHSSPEWFLKELRDHEEGKCVSLTAEYRGEVAGYVNVYRSPKEGPFVSSGYPEINNFGVLQKYQRHGIGSRLMDVAEQVAAEFSDKVCLGVGLHNGYGSAQRMYVKRGYVPDGSGVWYGDKPCTPYDTQYTCDDDLLLYMSKPVEKPVSGSAPACRVKVFIRKASPEDARTVAELAARLWPDHDADELTGEMQDLLANDECAVFLALADGEPVAFAQCQLRHDYVEGAESSPVGYMEGVYVAEEYRRQGVAARLLHSCELWTESMGCTEFASDCELTNSESRLFHLGTGFTEANRIACFVKHLARE